MISANWQFSALRRVATGFSIKESFRQSALTFSHKLTSRDVKKPATMVSVPNDRVEKELMSESYILALDQGTTSSRALLVDQAGKVVASANREFRQYYPQPAWVEHDAEEIWQSQWGVAEEVLRKATSNRNKWRPSASPTNVKRSCCGIVRPQSPSITPLCGSAAAPRRIATAFGAKATIASCAKRRAWSLMRISRPPRSPGCLKPCQTQEVWRSVESLPVGLWIAGSSG